MKVDMNQLTQALLPFNLPATCVQWLSCVYDACQTFDDYADGDAVDKARLDKLIWSCFVDLPTNPFFQANIHTLAPLMANCVLKWDAANSAESARRADEHSFMWRAGFYDLILMCVLLVHGTAYAKEHAESILKLYGESFYNYKKEFPNA
jgi:hypothetical protein